MSFRTKINAVSLDTDGIEPGKHYRVVVAGNADPSFLGEVVLGCDRHLGYCAVTVTNYNRGGWIGSQWWPSRAHKRPNYEDDSGARFVEVEPVSDEVWLVTDRSECGMVENETGVFRTREAAVAQAREWIEAHRDNSRAADEIDAVLANFDESAALAERHGSGLFGAGSERDASLFYVEVCRYDVRG